MRNKKSRGQALIEFVLVLPVLFILIINVVNFGALFYAMITVTHGTLAAAQYAVQGSAYLGYGQSPGIPATTAIQIKQLLYGPNGTCLASNGSSLSPLPDMCNLPNRATITVTPCSNNNGNWQAPETCLSSYTDPEQTTSVLATVTVSYRYCPLVPFWQYATLPSCSSGGSKDGILFNRTAVMRMIQ